jgi:hypothetical protein
VSLIENLKSYSEGIKISSNKNQLLNSFFEKGFPTIQDEEWKYTSLKKLISEDYSIEKNGSILSDVDISNHSLGFEKKIVFSDGKLIATPKMEGITFSDFSDFECSTSDTFLQLSSALANNGFTIKVDSNIVVDG